MKRSAILASAAVAMLMSGGAAIAADPVQPPPEPIVEAPVTYSSSGFYARVDAGVGIFDGQGDDEAFVLGVGIGYRWTDLLRTDLTFEGTDDYDLDGVNDVYAGLILANVYADFDFGSWVTPYVGFGVGYGEVDFDNEALQDDDEGVAFATHAGVALDVTEKMNLDLSYSFRTIDIDGPDFEDHAFRAGLRYNF